MIQLLAGGKLAINKREAARYAGMHGGVAEDIKPLFESCEKELSGVLSPRACFDIFDISSEGEEIDLGFGKVKSRALSENLRGCDKIALFAATIGAGADRLILKYGKVSPVRALVLDALASAAAESWCNEVNGVISSQFSSSRPRFSCGYGDLPLSLQADIFRALQVTKMLGVTLSDDFFMTPVKSVTAIIGVK